MNLARSSLKLFVARVASAGIQFLGITYFARELGAAPISDWQFIADLIGILGLGGLAILALMLVVAASVFLFPPRLNRWIILGLVVAVVGVLVWQAWIAVKVVKRKERRDAKKESN